MVSDELAQVAAEHGTPRRTVLLEASGATATAAKSPARKAAAMPLEVEDTPCRVLLSVTGLLARTADDTEPVRSGRRSAHDALRATVRATARGHVGAVTSSGRVLRLSVIDVPALPPTDAPPSLSGGVGVSEVLLLEPQEQVVGLISLAEDAAPVALGTRAGQVKRVTADHPRNKDTWEIIGLRDGDEVVAAAPARDEDELVFVSSEAQLLHFSAAAVRPQGRSAGGMAGIKLSAGARVVTFAVLSPARAEHALVVTLAGSQDALPGTVGGSAKVTPFALFPGKGRATGGVRAHRFLRGEDSLYLAAVAPDPVRAVGAAGQAVDLPELDERRDGSGRPLSAPVAGLG